MHCLPHDLATRATEGSDAWRDFRAIQPRGALRIDHEAQREDAQGFETQWFKTKAGDVIEGFVTKESGEQVEVHVATGASTVIKTDQIARRGKRENSMMPEGLVVKLTPHDVASLIAYLESLDGK